MMYGIDVIIVGPGAIKTPIWTKTDDPPPDLSESDYGKEMNNLRKEFFKHEAKGMSSELLAKKIFKLFESSRPKTRYTFMNRKFFDFDIPRLLPDRVLDRFLGKMLNK